MTILMEEKFRRKYLKNLNQTQSVWLSPEDKELLIKCQYRLQQTKASTAIKQLMAIGAKLILDDKIGEYLSILLDNLRKNERLGIIEAGAEIKKNDANL